MKSSRGIAYETVKQEFKTILRENHKKAWEQTSGETQLKVFLKKTSGKGEKIQSICRGKNENSSGTNCKTLWLNRHLYNIGIKPKPI